MNPALHGNFISNFGIGFLSTFLIPDHITVKTRKPGAEGLLITITDIGDYFDVRPAQEHLPIGTEVILELTSCRIKSWRGMEFLGYLKSIARFVSIPIHFTDAAGNTTVLCIQRNGSARCSASGALIGRGFHGAKAHIPSNSDPPCGPMAGAIG